MHRVVLSALFALVLTAQAFAGGTVTWPAPPLPPDVNPAATATPPILGWLNYFELNLQRAHKLGTVDLIFDGDNLAITSGHYGPTGGMWHHFNRINAMDYANPGDQTQNILWRLQNGEVDGLHPKLVVLMGGGSNLSPTCTPEQAAEGMKAVVAEYQKRCPDATILLCAVMPRGEKPTDPQRDKIKALNQLLAQLGDGKKVIYVDFGDQLLQSDGTITKDMLFDFVHPGAKGYEVWAKAIQPTVDQFFPPASLPPAPPEPAPANATNTATATQPLPAPEPIIGGGTVTWPAPTPPPGGNAAIIPTPSLGWLPHLQQNIDASRAMPKVDIIFDGDSITYGWMGNGGIPIWKKHYAPIGAYDFGISGDSTSGLLWRVSQGGEVDGLHPKLVVLLIGTNNMYSSSVEQIAGGIKAIVAAYQEKCPEATILLQGILPRGEQPTDGLRQKVKDVNKIISGYADGKKVIFLDWGEKLLTPEGLYTKPITGDFLHPQAPGYQIWADAIQPIVDQIFPPAPTPAAAAPKT